MTDTATPGSLSMPNDLDGYSSFVSRLLANNLSPEVVPPGLMLYVLERSLKHRVLLDQCKKGLFYGKEGSLLAEERQNLPSSYREMWLNHKTVPLLHSFLGLRTEVDELLVLLIDMMKSGYQDDFTTNQKVISEVVDEGGDVLFYLQAALNAVRSSVQEAMLANAAKLRVRFPNGYEEQAARQPDKAAEAAAQEALRA